MSASRDDRLKELGLTPVWRLRSSPAAQAEPATAPEAAPPSVAVAQSADREPVTVRGLPKVVPLDARATEITTFEWPQLKDSVAGCVACPLHKGRNKTVFGVGDEAAEWLFIGEGPGAEEDAKGEPFVGQAGKLLDNMLAAATFILRTSSNAALPATAIPRLAKPRNASRICTARSRSSSPN